MNVRTAQVLFFISILLGVHAKIANGSMMPPGLIKSRIIGNGTHISSFDFNVENIEYDDIQLGSITTLRKHEYGQLPMLSNGGQLIYTHNGIHVKVTDGNASLRFTGHAGQVITFSSGAGNSFGFEPESFTIDAPATNIKEVFLQIDGVQYVIAPGQRTQIVQIEIIQEIGSRHLIPNLQGNTPVVIFGSAHLDVSTIDIESLSIEDFAIKQQENERRLSTIVHVNDDGYLDMIVMFDDISHFFYNDISHATLKGYLMDGTIINGKGIILTPHQ